MDYFAGIYIENAKGRRRKLFLIISLIANIGILAVFKYYNFINENLSLLLHTVNFSNRLPYLTILLPIGLSFHTFQAMSYTIEVYRGNQKAERNFGIYSLYVMFFPQLVAGPIERPQNILYQFRTHQNFDYQRIADGLKLIAWGLIKKIVIADRLSVMVNIAYDDPHKTHGLSFIIATVFFSFQIFCDFSGYTDIALGTAKVLGFKLMKNFNSPYHAKSISEFWSRWHISLSTWFRDYLYIPLGGSRVTVSRWYFNLFFVFLISGLWHGANWTYIVWGAINGFYLVFASYTQNFRNKIVRILGLNKFEGFYSTIQTLTTFTLVTMAWVFFRAKTISDAAFIIKSAFTETAGDLIRLLHRVPFNQVENVASRKDLAIGAALIILLEVVHIMQKRGSIVAYIDSKPQYFRWSIYYLCVCLIIFGSTSNHSQFIYFQF
ncbi:MBOAT family O-acyltransferase [Mucilaginibacter sp. UYCu711]|uniref:MBOAT family O-acyltransferase n=1 Tax=Mucilaginibacter sp. UYCu711 TaxID=3156339 RepID=UPI003D1F59CD